MTEEKSTEKATPEEATETATATAEDHDHDHEHDHDHDHDHEHGAPEAEKLKQVVELNDVGPWKKHIKITVDREMIDKRIREKFLEMGRDTNIPGFRKGKAPIKVIQKRYQKEVTEQVRNEVLMASLEQLADEADIAPLSMPEIDPEKLEIPETGDFIYEFEVEVRPEFDLPEYKGIKLQRYVHEFTQEEIDREKHRLLRPSGQVVPKENGIVEMDDIITADVTFVDGGRELGIWKEVSLRVDQQLLLKDGVVEKFAEQISGAKADEQRTMDVTLSAQVADAALRGKKVKMVVDIKDIKTVKLPELTEDFLERNLGLSNESQFDELLKVLMERRLAHEQRQAFRQQIMQHFATTTDWELPQDMLRRQARQAIGRRIMEMRADGIPEEEIAARQRKLESDILQSTALALKEHFVLQKIAEVEKIEIQDADIEDEIDRMAERAGESPRRVRARLEKEDMIETVAAEMIERKALDLIIEQAEITDVKIGEKAEESASTVDQQAVPGEMRSIESESSEESEEGESASSEGETEAK